MKRIITLAVCVLMLCSACAAPVKPTQDSAPVSPTAAQNEGDVSLVVTDNAAAPTVAPTPAPTLYINAEEVTETVEYGFAYLSGSELRYAPKADAPVKLTLEQGSELFVKGQTQDWYFVVFNQEEGYISKDAVAMANGYINATEVKLRASAARSADIVMVTEMNTELVVLGRKNEWVHVVLKNDTHTTGYMHMDYVSYIDAYTTSDDITVLGTPSDSGEKLSTLSKGKRIQVLCSYGDWVKVQTDEVTGYVKAEGVQSAPVISKMARTRGYVTTAGVHIREGAATGFAIMGTLNKYAPLYITGETDEWYRIEYEVSGEGDKKTVTHAYIMKDFAEKGEPTVYVTGQDVNLRSGPGTGYDLLTKVRQNSKFVIIENKGDWFKGEVNGNIGYIRGDYLNTEVVGDGKRTNEFTDAEVLLAAKVVYLEAKGNGMDAYRAVANVIYNRVKSHKFPNTVKGVIYQPNQYSTVRHSKFETLQPSSQALKATRQVLNEGVRPLPMNVMFFFASYLGKTWGNDKEFYKVIGDNAFFRYVG